METKSRQEVFNYLVTTSRQGIPASKSTIKTDINDLMKLLPGASYTNRSGQATVTAERKGDTIFITAECDSLKAEVIRLEAMLSQTEQTENKEIYKRETTPFSLFKWCLISLILGILLSKVYKH